MTGGEKGALIGAGLALAGGIAYGVTRKPAATTPPTTTGPAATAATPDVTFSGGPSESVSVSPSGTRLASLKTHVANTGALPGTWTVSVPISPVSGTTYAGGKWFTTYGRPSGASGVPSVQVTVPGGKSVDITWSTTWSGHPGTYRSVAQVKEANGTVQTFPDSQTFTVTTILTPAALHVETSGGPVGSFSGNPGSTDTHIGGALTTIISNSGETDYKGAISCILAPAGSNSQADGLQFYTTYGGLSSGATSVNVTVPAGGSITIQWFTNWTFETATDGKYHAVVVANP